MDTFKGLYSVLIMQTASLLYVVFFMFTWIWSACDVLVDKLAYVSSVALDTRSVPLTLASKQKKCPSSEDWALEECKTNNICFML